MLDAYASEDLAALNEHLQLDAIEKGQGLERKNRLYGFVLGNHKLFFGNEVKRELFESIKIKKLPLMPEYILGLCNVRGNLVPVVDLAVKYGLLEKSTDGSAGKTLIISDGIDMVGLVINKTLIPVDFHDNDLFETDITVDKRISFFIQQSYSIHDEAWHQIDHKVLFNTLTIFDY